MEPSLLATLVLCVLVFLAGFVDAIAGGGGLISVPAYFAVGLPPHAALATNKFSSVLGTLTAAWRYWRAGKLQVRPALLAAAGALAGSAAGARAVLLVPPAAVHAVVLVLVPAALVVLLLQDRLVRRPVDSPVGPVSSAGAKAVGIGLLVGAWDGFFGPGTGTFLTLAFYLVLRLDLLVAAGNARLVNLASNVGAVVVFLIDGRVVFPLALYAAAAGIAGNQLGSMLALRKGEKVIKPFLVAVLVVLLAEVFRRRFF